MERYVIRGGREGYDRLLVLSQEHGPHTAELLARAGVSAGQRCVDLGCGGGEVTIEIARRVAPDGLAVGIDLDPVKLELGRQRADALGITNVEFKSMNVDKWDEPDSYDVAYSRFVMHHLSRPRDLLARMWAAVRAGGVIIVEDADHDGWYCHPPNRGFDLFVRTFAEAVDRAGGDHSYGRKLYEAFLEVGIPRPEVKLVQSARTAGDPKWMAWLTMEATKDVIVAEGITSSDEIAVALEDLAKLTEEPSSIIGSPRVFQVWARRDATPS